MDDKLREEMNQKIDILFEQIERLNDGNKQRAAFALGLWKSAKTCEFLGLGPMEARHEYKAAYSAFKEMGLEIGGMIKPYESSNAPHERAAEGGPLDAVVSGNSRIITMIDITSLSVGDKVYYQPGHYGDREYENGIVKEIREGMDDAVWVVYHCAGEWDRYREFTSAKTNLRDLKLGWKP